MKLHRIACFAVLMMAWLCPVLAQDADVPTLIAQGDAASDQSDYEPAAVAYVKALKLDPMHYEAHWKAGDMYTELADQFPEKQKDQKLNFFLKAEEYCLKAIEINPQGWEGHAKLSVVYGRLGLFRGGKEKVKLAQKVRAEAEKAIEINPESALAMHVLGRWHQNVADLSGLLKFFAKKLYGEELKGSHEEAVDWFKKAAIIEPEILRHHYQMGVSYKALKQKELAKTSLETAVALEPENDEEIGFLDDARKLLKKLK